MLCLLSLSDSKGGGTNKTNPSGNLEAKTTHWSNLNLGLQSFSSLTSIRPIPSLDFSWLVLYCQYLLTRPKRCWKTNCANYVQMGNPGAPWWPNIDFYLGVKAHRQGWVLPRSRQGSKWCTSQLIHGGHSGTIPAGLSWSIYIWQIWAANYTYKLLVRPVKI